MEVTRPMSFQMGRLVMLSSERSQLNIFLQKVDSQTYRAATRVKIAKRIWLTVMRTRLMARSRVMTINFRGRPPTKGARASAMACGNGHIRKRGEKIGVWGTDNEDNCKNLTNGGE